MADAPPKTGSSAARAPVQGAQPPLPVWIKLIALICLAPLIAVLFPTFLLAFVGMSPSILVYLFDKTHNKHFALTVALMNLCGILPALGELWSNGQTMPMATGNLTDPVFWLMSLGSAAVGWLVFTGMPPVIAAYYATASEARLQNLMERQRQLLETWGEEVRDDVPPEEGEEAGLEATPTEGDEGQH